ncbi:unnamed protein product [Clonostachys byssicola]|uniref:F-box domain-containing protein n=1 Tax=Clonostachys byssicola TaxID=160290 RepID=A0A9N9UFF1_9HYPO|nr:unnamed protein product [Clonostachys byssicola]
MDSMPNEILTHIFSNLESEIPPHDSWEKAYMLRDSFGPPNDLLSVSLVCRKFRNAARPFMYRTVSITSETLTRISPQTVVRTRRPRDYGKVMDGFLSTLFAEPKLGLNIRHLRIDSWETRLNIDRLVRQLVEYNKDISEAQKKLLSGWLTFPTVHLEDGVVLLLLILSPKLQSVDLRTYTNDQCFTEYLSGIRKIENSVFQPRVSDPVVADASEQNINDPETASGNQEISSNDSALVASGNQEISTNDSALVASSDSHEEDDQSMLPDLKEIRRRYISPRACAAISGFQDVLYHPRVETLRLQGFLWNNKEINQEATFSEISCNLKQLQLESCLVNDRALENILTRCTQLHYLSITLPDIRRVGFMGMSPTVSVKEMGHVVRQHGTKLQTFELDTFDYNYFYRAKRPLGSLRTLESLRHLKISAGDLLKLKASAVEGDVDTDDEEEEEEDEDEDVFSAPLKDNLPLGLETLYIVRTSRKVELRDSQLLEAVRDIIRYKPFTKLRKVEVEITGWLLRDVSAPGWEASARRARIYSDSYSMSQAEQSVPKEVTVIVFDRREGATRHRSGN